VLESMLAHMPSDLPVPPEQLLNMLSSMPEGEIENMFRQFQDSTPTGLGLQSPTRSTVDRQTASSTARGSRAAATDKSALKQRECDAWSEVLRCYCNPTVAAEYDHLNAEPRELMLSALQATAEDNAQQIVVDEAMKQMQSSGDEPSARTVEKAIAKMEKSSTNLQDPLIRALEIHMSSSVISSGVAKQLQPLLSVWGIDTPRFAKVMRHEMGFQAHKQKGANLPAGHVSTAHTNSTVVKPESIGRTNWQTLKLICATDLKLFEVASGSVLRGKLIVDPITTVGVTSLLEDSAGGVIQLGLYNLLPGAPVGTKAQEAAERLLPKGTQLSIAEPFLKIFRDGNRGVRVDTPSDVKIEPTGQSSSANLKEARVVGNKFVRDGSYEAAAAEYWQSLRTEVVEKDVAQVLSNRAQAHLKQDMWEAALADSAAALLLAPTSDKTWQRYAAALHGLQQPGLAQRALAVRSKDGSRAEAPQLEVTSAGVSSVVQATLVSTICSGLYPEIEDGLKEMQGESADEIRKVGNAAYKSQNFRKACDMYSLALDTSDTAGEVALLLSNLALCALHTSHWHDAIACAAASLRLRQDDNPKPLFRLVKGLAWMRELGTATQVIEMVRSNPSAMSVLNPLAVEVSAFERLYKNRSSIRLSMFELAQFVAERPAGTAGFFPDWAATDALTFAKLQGKGRGVVASRDIEAHEVLLVQRARVSASHGSVEKTGEMVTDLNSNSRLMNDGSQIKLKSIVSSTLRSDTSLAAVMSFMCDGKRGAQLDLPVWEDLLHHIGRRVLPLLSSQAEYVPSDELDSLHLDSAAVGRILATNVHGHNSQTFEQLLSNDSTKTPSLKSKLCDGGTTGLFPAISLLNHSSKPNAALVPLELVSEKNPDGKSIKEVSAIVAPARIAKGTEVTVSYMDDASAVERKWGIRDD